MYKLVFNTHCSSNFLCYTIILTAKCNGESGIPDKCQQPKIVERLVLWYEFDCDEKLSYVKLPIKEKYSHTIITERYRFCCLKYFQRKSKRSTEGCSKLKRPETRQFQKRLVPTLEHMQVPKLDRTRCPEKQASSVGMPHPMQMFYGSLA